MNARNQTLDRPRHLSFKALPIFLTVAAAVAFGGAHVSLSAAAQETGDCVFYDDAHGRPITIQNDPACALEAAVHAAAEEAQSWPDFDSTAIGNQVVAARAAAEEAQSWPDFDSTAIGNQVVAARSAAEEAQGWPDFDSTAIGNQVVAAREAEVAGVPQFQSTSAL